MSDQSVRTDEDIEETVQKYGDMLFRICLVMLKNKADAEDIVQETIIRYIQADKAFDTEEYKKAWLITVAANKCRDMLRFSQRHRELSLEDINEYAENKEDSHILQALTQLPKKYRIVLTLHYVEEYKVRDIAKIIGKTESAVKMRLQKGRRLLEELYRKEYM